jgi:transcriptional regulator with XRE-family HTH domain
MTGEEFKAARIELARTQAEMAEAIGLGAAPRISEIEHDKVRVTRTVEILVNHLLVLHRGG